MTMALQYLLLRRAIKANPFVLFLVSFSLRHAGDDADLHRRHDGCRRRFDNSEERRLVELFHRRLSAISDQLNTRWPTRQWQLGRNDDIWSTRRHVYSDADDVSVFGQSDDLSHRHCSRLVVFVQWPYQIRFLLAPQRHISMIWLNNLLLTTRANGWVEERAVPCNWNVVGSTRIDVACLKTRCLSSLTHAASCSLLNNDNIGMQWNHMTILFCLLLSSHQLVLWSIYSLSILISISHNGLPAIPKN